MGSILILSPYFLYSQNKDAAVLYNTDGIITFQVYATYVSSAELQNDLGSSISFLRDAMIELKGGYGFGGELTFNPRFNEVDLVFYLSSEYLKVKDDELIMRFENDTAVSNVKFIEEYDILPLEAGLKWHLPVSTERFRVFIGGGAGLYFGNRTRTIGPYKTSPVSRKPGFSMNVMAGMEYFFQRNLSLDFEFKFREATFDSKDEFEVDQVTINGNVYDMGNPVYSRVLVDGTRLSLGVKYHF